MNSNAKPAPVSGTAGGNGTGKAAEGLLPEGWSAWRLCEVIGEGAFATVYRAERTDEAGTSCSAVKVLRVPAEESRDRYIDEIKTMLSLKGHPNIVSIEDYATVRRDGGDYILIRMELLTPLDRYAAENEPDERETIKVGTDICSALEHCRKKNVLHLDIKPSNIFISDEGVFKLGDFGISCSADNLADEAPRECTPGFMGPELYRLLTQGGTPDPAGTLQDNIDGRYDQYSLGLVLYWLRNHRRLPFLPDRLLSLRDRQEALRRRVSGEPLPQPEDVSPGLKKIILRACAYDPADRYGSPAEMKKDLEGLLNGTGRSGNRKKYAAVLIAVLACAAALLLIPQIRQPFKSLLQGIAGHPVWESGEADASGTCGENLRWGVYGTRLRISGSGGMYDYSTDNQPPWEEYKSEITEVVVEEGTTKIGRYAFFEFEKLTEVRLPGSLRRINSMAFGYCNRLPALTVPEGVEHIEKSIIYRCPKLAEIDLPGSLRLIEGSFAGECGNLALITLGENCKDYVLRDGVLFDAAMEELICHPAGLEDLEYSIPDGVRTIGTYAFDTNRSLMEVSIPEGLTTIGSCAFSGCVNLRSVVIPDSVGTLDIYAFYGCEKLESVSLSGRITWIDQQAFYNCSSLREITLPPGLRRIGTSVFNGCTELEKVVIPGSVTHITGGVFDGCPDVVIWGESGSYAEQYAAEQGIPFSVTGADETV